MNEIITKEEALECLEDMDDFARIADVAPIGPYNLLKRYIEQSERYKKALELLLESSEECEDQDGWAAFMLSADDYHKAKELYEENENN